jgi:hypothetical protein
MLKVAMNRTVIPIHAWDMIPLATGTQSKNDSIQHAAAINPVSPSGLRWVSLVEQRFDAFPKSIGYFPHSGQASFAFGHNSLLELSGLNYATKSYFEIVSKCPIRPFSI